MHAKSIARVLIAVLTALALTVLVAAAQSEPAAPEKALPEVIEKGESASPAANMAETEPNNGFAKANVIQIGDVISGKIGNPNDQDYFKIPVTAPGAQVLIDVDAAINGSALDAHICLYDVDKVVIACNDDSDGLDSLLFIRLDDDYGPPYYLRIRDYNYPYEGGNTYTYTLSIYHPLLVSAAKNGKVADVAFNKSDVLAHYDFADGTEKWMLFFDASDVGITQNVVGFSSPSFSWGEPDDEIFVALAKAQSLLVDGAQQTVTPYDVLQFVPGATGQYGPSTEGELSFHYRGSDYGLGGAAGKIDAIADAEWNVSTAGSVTVYGTKMKDEDVFALIWGVKYLYGNEVPGLAAEDVVGADDNRLGRWYLTILGSGIIDGYPVTQKDIFMVWFDHVTGIYWRGTDHHFNYVIDAFDVVDFQ